MKRFAVAMIKGGLGNQLFAYAAARAYAIRTRRELLLDHASGYARDGYGRAYKLNLFPVAAAEAPPQRPATCNARRVLPTPPTPVSVTRR